jgi:hypothetical protein
MIANISVSQALARLLEDHGLEGNWRLGDKFYDTVRLTGPISAIIWWALVGLGFSLLSWICKPKQLVIKWMRLEKENLHVS